MMDKMSDFLLKSLDNSSQSVFLMERNTVTPFYANKQARLHYCDEQGNVEINRIFNNTDAAPFFRNSVLEQFKNKDFAMIYEISTVTKLGDILICDIQIKYCDDARTILFLELFPKADTRMEQAISQVSQSTRADAILNFDETLTLVHGNTAFYQIFEMDETIRYQYYNNGFANSFQDSIRTSLLREIHENLEKQREYCTKTKIVSSTGQEKWYSLEFQKRILDNSGVEKLLIYMVNIEKQIEVEEALDTVSQYFNALQDLSEDMLYRVDLQTKTLYRTSKQAEMFGLSAVTPNYPQSIIESGIVHPEDEKNYRNYGMKLLEGEATSVEIRIKSTDGEYGYRRLTCTPVYGQNNTVKEMFGKIVNIQMVRELEEQANFDALTKLLNKRAMLESTSQTIFRATQQERHALFFMDLDNFKYVNDNLGHAFGDFLLMEVAKRLSECVRSQDYVGRVGGDEFVIFLRDVPSVDMLLGKGKLLLSSISEDIVDGEKRHSISGSVGIAIYPDHGTSYEELYHHADLALYRSKHKGKNQVTLFSQEYSK